MPGVLAALVLDVRADHADLSPPPAPPPHHPDATRQVNLATEMSQNPIFGEDAY